MQFTGGGGIRPFPSFFTKHVSGAGTASARRSDPSAAETKNPNEMKVLKTLFALTALAAFTLPAGCIEEDMSDCPPEVNTELTFSYTGDENDPTMFGRMIDRVTLFVFDNTDGQHILTKTVEKSELILFQGTKLYLPAGEYTILSWANAFDATEIIPGTLSTGRVHHPSHGTTPQGTIPTNDHLYYGEYPLTVPAAATLPGNSGSHMVTGDIPHRSAHINIEVYTKGFGSAGDPASWPMIEMTNLMPQYKIQMGDAAPYVTSYFPAMGWDADKKGAAARFQTLRFAADNTADIVVRDPADRTVKASLDLRQHIIDHTIAVDGRHEVTISVLFEFTDLGVSITVPDWTGGNVDPDI